MDDERGPSKLDFHHERRLLQLEAEFGKRGRVTMLERELGRLTPVVDEMALARRITAGVAASLDERETAGLNRWQRAGIAAGIVSGIGAFLLAAALELAKAFGHG